MKVRNEPKHDSVDIRFFAFSGAIKSITGKKRLSRPFVKIWSENSKTTPN